MHRGTVSLPSDFVGSPDIEDAAGFGGPFLLAGGSDRTLKGATDKQTHMGELGISVCSDAGRVHN